MGFCAGQSGAEFTLLSRLSATSRTTNCEGLFFFDFHDYIMQLRIGNNWSIVSSFDLTEQFCSVPKAR